MKGRRVLVTRAAGQAEPLARLLSERGAVPLLCPLIETVPPADPAPLRHHASQLEDVDWLLLTSANAVRFLAAVRTDVPPSLRIAAVGPGTAAAAEAQRWTVSLVAEKHVGEGLLAALDDQTVRGARFLLPRAARARDVVPEGLRERGARVDVVTAYETRMPAEAPARLRALLEEGPIDAVLFTSPSTVLNALRALDGGSFGEARLGYIGPIAADAGRERGLRIDFVADPHTSVGLVEALESCFTEDQPS